MNEMSIFLAWRLFEYFWGDPRYGWDGLKVNMNRHQWRVADDPLLDPAVN